MGSTPRDQDPRRAEILEALVELYLRLNGYFSIRNYLEHRVEKFGLLTEFDLLAIRMPFQEEAVEDGRRQPNDQALILPEDGKTVDCVIAEVKEASVEFNKPIRCSDGPRLIIAALRMFGVLPKDAFNEHGVAHQVAHDLHCKINMHGWIDLPESHNAEHRISPNAGLCPLYGDAR